MPELPKLPKQWPALFAVGAITDSTAQTSSSFLVTLGLVFLIAFFICVVATLTYLMRAVWKDEWQVLLLIAVFQLPYSVIWRHKRVKGLCQGWKNKPETVRIELGTTRQYPSSPSISLPDFALASPVVVTETGIQRSSDSFLGWEELTGFEYLGEAEQYYRVRFWKHPLPESKTSKQAVWKLLAPALASTLLTFYAAYFGWSHYGFREDVKTAIAFASAHGFLLLMLLCLSSNSKPAATPSFDLFVTGNTIPATEFLTFVEQHVPQNKTGELL